MRVRRPIIIPAILAFGVAGSILSSPAMAIAAAQAPAVQVASGPSGGPYIFYHG